MKAEDIPDQPETFSSDVTDLGEIDLSAVRELPNSVLRSAILRVCEELAGNDETLVAFQSSLHGTRPPGGTSRPPRE